MSLDLDLDLPLVDMNCYMSISACVTTFKLLLDNPTNPAVLALTFELFRMGVTDSTFLIKCDDELINKHSRPSIPFSTFSCQMIQQLNIRWVKLETSRQISQFPKHLQKSKTENRAHDVQEHCYK